MQSYIYQCSCIYTGYAACSGMLCAISFSGEVNQLLQQVGNTRGAKETAGFFTQVCLAAPEPVRLIIMGHGLPPSVLHWLLPCSSPVLPEQYLHLCSFTVSFASLLKTLTYRSCAVSH